MQLTKIPVVVLILTARTCGGEIVIPIPSPDESVSSLVDDLVNIVTSCYGDRIDAIGVGGDVPDGLLRTLATQHSIPVALMDATDVSPEYPPAPFLISPRKLQVFIVEGSSVKNLWSIFNWNIRHSVWWNITASFFLLDRSRGCVNAKKLLMVVWKMLVILNAKVICYHHKGGRIIFNYNPFTSQAPVPWQLVEIIPLENGRPFTLFSREYRRDEAICMELDFDKAKHMEGHGVLTEGIGNVVDTENNCTASIDPYWLKHERIFRIVSRALNITPIFTGLERFDGLEAGIVYEEMHKCYSSLVVKNRIIATTYPHEQVTFVIISQFRDYAPRLNTTDLSIVYLITLMFFKFFVPQYLISAFRNLIPLICNTGFRNSPDNSSTRICLTGLLLFAVTIGGVYHSNLTFQLTKRSPLKNVETQEDLVSLGYKKLYVYDNRESVIMYPELHKRFVITKSNEDCFTLVMHDSSAACIWKRAGARHLARRFGFHVSSESFRLTNHGFPISADFFLKEKVDKILATCVEADILETWPMQSNISYLTDFQFGTFGEKVDVKSIDLREMKFAFVILGVGLGCATITFILESVIRYKYVFAAR